MKIQNIANPLISSENMSSSIMGMDAKGADMATYYLRDKIYSDKILAVVREYICNALDEHKKHNIKEAVVVGVSSGTPDVKLTFFVRDYAKGLSEDNIRNVFGMYFRSTKSNNNDQIGGFGIGSKAGHSYTDTFYVKSFYNGVCSLYACALGGGDTGVPVGHIFKVSEEPTTETGLEVSLEIKNASDYAQFTNHCFSFVKFCSQNIIFNRDGEVSVPETPSSEEVVGDFKFRFYKGVSTVLNVRIHMGDVCYENFNYQDKYAKICNGKLNHNTVMVVEVPMGKMTLPISREGFEVTPANSRVMEELDKAVVKVCENDLGKIKPMTIAELIDTKHEYNITGGNFCIYKKDQYPDIYPVAVNAGKLNENALDKIDNKFVCVLLPNKMSANYWRNKISEHATLKGKNYYYVNECFLNQCKDRKELEEFFEFKKVKSSYFGWEKTGSKDAVDINTRFGVSGHWNSNHYWENRCLNALEIHNKSRSALSLPTASTIDEAKKQIKNTNFEDRLKLEHFSFFSGQSASNTNGAKVFFRSKSLKKAMLEIGWLDAAESEYKNKLKIIASKEEEDARLANQIQNACPKFLIDHKDRKNKFGKKSKYAKKAFCIMEKIRNENSLRAKIIKSLDKNAGYWYSDTNISRDEFRKILKMK
jgi:hypothetical protein